MSSCPTLTAPPTAASTEYSEAQWTVFVSLSAAVLSQQDYQDALMRFMAERSSLCAIISIPSGVQLALSFSTSTAFGARTDADARVGQALSEIGVDPQAVDWLDIKVVREDSLRRQVKSTLTEYVGFSEVAEVVGVSKQRIPQLAESDAFPASGFRLRATPVWRLVDLLQYLRYR